MTTHWKGSLVSESGFKVGDQSSSTEIIDSNGVVKAGGVAISDSSGNLQQAGEPLRLYTKRIAIGFADGTAETDTGWDLPTGAIVYNVFLQVDTAEATGATKTIDVGTLSTDSGDANGFLAGVSVAATGLVKGTLLNTGQTVGALLSVDEGGTGELVPEPCVAPGSVSVSWTPGSVDFAELAGSIHIVYAVIA